MKSRSVRQVVLCGLAVALMGVLLVGGLVHAAGAQFNQRERVAVAMDNSPEAVVAALESTLTQQQLDAIESALFPAPTDLEKRSALDDVKLKLLRAGFAADDPLLAAIDARVDEIAVEAAVPQE